MIKILIAFYLWTLLLLASESIDDWGRKPFWEKFIYISILFIILITGQLFF